MNRFHPQKLLLEFISPISKYHCNYYRSPPLNSSKMLMDVYITSEFRCLGEHLKSNICMSQGDFAKMG